VRDISQRKREEQQRDLLQSQLQQARKLEAVGRLTGGVAHDYNNMLTVINGHAEFALEVVPEDSPVVEHIREIQSAAEHSAQLTRQLLGFARRQVIAPRSLDLNVTLYAMLKMVRTLVGEDVTVHWRPGADLWLVQADPTQIQQVVMNLCSNGRDAISDSGTVVIETRNWVFDESYRENHAGFVPGEFVMLAVTDDGVGMSEETLSHAFEPFFSTKESGRGTGLGLASVYGIAKQNGGFVNVYSEPGSGTAVKLYLPRHVAMEGVDGHPQRSADLAATGRGAVVLVVEDNAAILQLATRTLERDGHTVLAADTPEHALSAARDLDWAVDLMVTDVILPGMNGRELAEQVIARNPRVRVLFTSGYTENVIAQRGVLKEGVHFLSKPYTPQSLLEKVVEILR
jgi:nitrogen-specific signal transduction histidine kinase